MSRNYCGFRIESRLGSFSQEKAARIILQLGFLSITVALMAVSAFGQDDAPRRPIVRQGATQIGGPAVGHEFKGDLRNIPTAPRWQPGDPIKEIPRRGESPQDLEQPSPRAVDVDPLLDRQLTVDPIKAAEQFPSPLLNFEGEDFTGVTPPDTVGDVSEQHFIQMVNHSAGSAFSVYDKGTGALLAGPLLLDSLGTGNCASGLGDPIVLYDQLADRWLLSEFSQSGNRLCIYISQSSDPISGGWYNYEFQAPQFPDYPKYAVWTDAYYVSSNESESAVYALDRVNMLNGAPARPYQRFEVADLNFGFNALIPADVDGESAPPQGSPGYFMRHNDDESHSSRNNDPSQDFLEIFEFSVDFNNASNSTLTGPFTISATEFDSNLCGLTSFSCFDQPGGSPDLDPLREVIMWRLQYRNFGSHEALVGNFVVDVDGTDRGGIRWFELRKSDTGPWALFQEGTFSPDSDNRWMGAIAMNGSGDIALGYNVVSNTLFPGIRYAGRLQEDPVGSLPQGEYSLIEGSASNSSNRYGDYSAMSVDPADDCSFWFTGEYNTSSFWSTRVGALRMDDCQTCEPSPIADAGPDQTICPGESVTIGSPSAADHSYLWSPTGQTTAEITVSPSQTTEYTVTATTTCGSTSDSVTVFVDPEIGGGFTEDFEQGLGQWSTSGLWHLASNSSCASPGYSSPVNSAYYGSDASCSYDTGTSNSGTLISPEIAGINADSTLEFQYFRRVEQSNSPVDRTEVHVLTDGGATSTTVWSANATDSPSRGWQESGLISLTAFAGEVIQLRFFFDTVDASQNGFPGWMVDDVVVTGSSQCDGGGGNQSPQVTITSPPNGSSFTEGSEISFQGTASDSEDGDLTGNISWSSNQDGFLGTGSSVDQVLSVGNHEVTASVTDSGGLSDSDVISITVNGSSAFLISGPQPGTAGVNNCFDVTGSQPGAVLTLYFARNPGSTAVSGCSTPLDLDNPRPRDTQVADSEGNATLCFLVPGNASGLTLHHQVLDSSSPGCQVSNVVSHTY